MKVKAVLLLIVLCQGIKAYAQSIFKYPLIKDQFKTISEVIPSGWTVMDSLKTDLNKDKMLDHIIILRYKNKISEDNQPINYQGEKEVYESEYFPKVMIIAFGEQDSSLKVFAKYTRWILEQNMAVATMDPFGGITPTKNGFSIDYLTGGSFRTSLTYKFRFQNGGFYLIGATATTYQTGSRGDEIVVDLNCLTGKGLVNGREKSFNHLPLASLQEFRPYSKKDPLVQFDLGN